MERDRCKYVCKSVMRKISDIAPRLELVRSPFGAPNTKLDNSSLFKPNHLILYVHTAPYDVQGCIQVFLLNQPIPPPKKMFPTIGAGAAIFQGLEPEPLEKSPAH